MGSLAAKKDQMLRLCRSYIVATENKWSNTLEVNTKWPTYLKDKVFVYSVSFYWNNILLIRIDEHKPKPHNLAEHESKILIMPRKRVPGNFSETKAHKDYQIETLHDKTSSPCPLIH